MSESGLIYPGHLPHPWLLDEPWLERLDIPQHLQRAWLHLTPTERMMVQASYALAAHYQDRDLLQAEKNPRGLVHRIGNELDRHWLKSGKGRAVDIKHVLDVLIIFETYRQWAEACGEIYMPKEGRFCPLDIVVPYWLNPQSPANVERGPGFLRITCTPSHFSIGKLGQIIWGAVGIDLQELSGAPRRYGWTEENYFAENPFQWLGSSSLNDDHARMVSHIGPEILQQVTDPSRKLRSVGPDTPRHLLQDSVKHPIVPRRKSDLVELHQTSGVFCWRDPTQQEVQGILDLLSQLLFANQSPRPHLQFEVAPDLTSITAATRLNTTEWQSGVGLNQLSL